MNELKNQFNEKWEKPEHVSQSIHSVLQGCCSLPLKQTMAKGGFLDEMYSYADSFVREVVAKWLL